MKATVLHLVPPICVLMTRHPDIKNYDLSSVHLAMVAAAPLKQELAEDVTNLLNIKAVRQGI